MRELTYIARRTVEWREAPDPEIRSALEAIVAPVATTSCDVDSSILAGHGFIDPPFALGHECVARALGASDVLYVDPDAEHRRLAESYGARTAEEIEPIPHGFDLAVEATGRVDQLALAVGSLAPEGICESAGNHFRPGELPLLDMYLTGVTLRVARDNVRAHIPDALDLAASGKVSPERVVSHVLDWEQLPDALPEKRLKPVFVRDITPAPASIPS
ncbi:hypothetical protein FNH09_23950 [Streptomyces adustus]|uniref:Uncharacterized protein n=1 Tax=Streptomyces adustus TaxID=1609272 RepID=A0A5N8VG17_9ACTN|nr:hypothetical protein [Streptomyces adustus]MPY34190.1 hypothetical protein [Streptomyces adustus]